MTESSTDQSFCAGCGAPLSSGARFCASCGRPSALSQAKPAAAPTAAPAGSSRRAALLVFAGVAAAGFIAAYAAIQNSGTGERAVPGTPGGRPAEQRQAADGSLPADHPPIDLPAEVLTFLEGLKKTAEAAPQDKEAWTKLARARYKAGMLNRKYYPGAQEAIDHLLGLDPKDTEALRMKANIAYDSEQFAEAEKLFRQYLEIEPKDPAVRTDLASAVLFQGRAEEAQKMYSDVIATNPDFVQAHVNLGIALHNAGKRDEALVELKRGRELAKDPEQQQRVDQIIAAAEGRKEQGAAEVAEGAPTGMPGSGAQGGAAVAPTSNASTPFQKSVDQLFAEHSIVGPRISKIEWTGETSAKIVLPGFPMDQMPAVVRNKFKSTMNEKIAGLLGENTAKSDVAIELVDDTGRVMDKLDAKELVGAFAPQEG